MLAQLKQYAMAGILQNINDFGSSVFRTSRKWLILTGYERVFTRRSAFGRRRQVSTATVGTARLYTNPSNASRVIRNVAGWFNLVKNGNGLQPMRDSEM
jgi:hypothetical protein